MQMKKYFFYCVVFFFTSVSAVAQQAYIDSFRRKVSLTNNDTIQLVLLRNIARSYSELNPDSSFLYAEKALKVARKLNLKLDEGSALREMGYALLNRANLPKVFTNTSFIHGDPGRSKKRTKSVGGKISRR